MRRGTWAEQCCSTPRTAFTSFSKAEPHEAPGGEGHKGIRGRDSRLHHKKDEHQTSRCVRRPPKHHGNSNAAGRRPLSFVPSASPGPCRPCPSVRAQNIQRTYIVAACAEAFAFGPAISFVGRYV